MKRQQASSKKTFTLTAPQAGKSSPATKSSRPASDTAPPDWRLVRVMLPVPLNTVFDYAVPPEMDAPEPGQYVLVPLGSRQVIGVSLAATEAEAAGFKDAINPPSPLPPEAAAQPRLKKIEKIFDMPPMTASLRQFITWMADYTLAPLGAVLRLALSVPAAIEPPRPKIISPNDVYYRRTTNRKADADGEHKPYRRSPQGKKILEILEDGLPHRAADLCSDGDISPASLKTLLRQGLIEIIPPPPSAENFPELAPPPTLRKNLNAAQQAAAENLSAKLGERKFSVTLLDGVTGSGKTEVYFAAIDAALRQNRQALVLLPEIALSLQWLTRFRDYFGFDPLIWHSGLTPRTRRETWRHLATTQRADLAHTDPAVKVVVGARSALFLPFADLGLIIVDEEHDQGYKQEDGVLYHARDMAVMRGKFSDATVVLASATPSLESQYNVTRGRFDRVYLPERPGGAVLPQVALLDLRLSPPPIGKFLSETLVAEMQQTLAAGEQVLLFLNRRGYAPLTLCRACGFRFACRHCTSWLVEHRRVGRLVCHLCGANYPLPRLCPDCGAEHQFAACGPGVERIAEEVEYYFPTARRAIMASDVVEGEAGAANLVDKMVQHEIDIMIGTQMMAKGHHFPHLTLVGVVDADLGLGGGDMRAGEKTFQILHQVGGRAGRVERPGRVVLQTSAPDHAVMKALVSGNRDAFLRLEMAERERHGLPPFTRLTAVIVSSEDAALAEATARELGRRAPRGDQAVVFGPAPAPLAKWRDRYRYRLLMKTPRGIAPQPIMRAWLASVKFSSAVRVAVDIDPMSFL
ncbi:MAG: primosomal protein N' [Candidatus Symbiobacter sp.]|nr:primosomal protein N' [Candidatus Symbiobacter sp.]